MKKIWVLYNIDDSRVVGVYDTMEQADIDRQRHLGNDYFCCIEAKILNASPDSSLNREDKEWIKFYPDHRAK